MATRADVVVIGSGAAGLVAALVAHDEGAEVMVLEKSALLGGTSAMSGGIVWMPNNHLQAEAGIDDSREAALDYLASLSLGQIDSDMAATFVDEGPEMLRWVAEHTPCSFHLIRDYPDYHPEHPGGLSAGGRSLDNGLFAYPQLGQWADRIRNQRGAQPVMLTETPLGGATELPEPAVIGERLGRGQNGMGLALVGALVKACLDREIDLRLESPAEHLVVDDGAIVGVHVGAEARATIDTRTVVLATGGFEWNQELCRTFLRGPMTAPAGSPTSTGDGLVMAMEAGARLGNMRNAWWVPVLRIPGEMAFDAPSVHLILVERTRPRSLMVNADGRRFTNEAGNYNAMGGAFHAFDPSRFEYPNQPCWLVVDAEYRRRYDLPGAPAGTDAPPWMSVGDTVEALAEEIGLEPARLVATVDRFNRLAAEGADADFGRGESAYDTFNGDQTRSGVAQTLEPLDEGPYFAMPIESGALGTNGGPKTDTRGRVLSLGGGVIEGLFAAGNVMAAPTGMVYGGAGGTLGPAMTFGYIAGREAGRRAAGQRG